jgi:hypothetical protein
VPRHAVAIGFGDSLKPLPIVPHRLTAESLAATAPAAEAEDVQVIADVPQIHINRGPAAEWLREKTLDQLGARTSVVDGVPTSSTARSVPQTRLDPSDLAVQERPSGLAMGDAVDRAIADAAIAAGAAPIADAAAASASGAVYGPVLPPVSVADARDPSGAAQAVPVVGTVPGVGRTRVAPPAALLPLGLTLMGLGLLMTMGGSIIGWRRGEHPAWATRTLVFCDEVAVRAMRLAPSGVRTPRLPDAWGSRVPTAWSGTVSSASARRIQTAVTLFREKGAALAQQAAMAARRVRRAR